MNTSTTSIPYPSEQHKIQSTVRPKGQITVPSDVRALLDLQTGDKVSFIVDNNKNVHMVKKHSIVAQTAGVLKSLRPIRTAEQLREEAERTIAEEAIRRAG